MQKDCKCIDNNNDGVLTPFLFLNYNEWLIQIIAYQIMKYLEQVYESKINANFDLLLQNALCKI